MTVKLGSLISEYSVRNKADEDIPVYSVTNEQGFCTGYFSKEVASQDRTTYKIVPRGCFAYNPSRINVGSVDVQECEDRVIVSPLYVVFSVDEKLNSRYLLHYLKSDITLTFIKAYASGSVRDNLKFSILKDFPINLPSVEEQEQIVATLDGIEHLIELRKEEIASLEKLVKSRFIELFGDSIDNPKAFPVRKLKTLSRKISDGVHAKPQYTETGRPFLSVVNINKGVINFDGCKFVSEEAYQKMIKSTHPERGDVLYTKVGATYGIPAYVDTDTEFCLYVSVCLIKPLHEEINSRFLSLSMGMPYVKRQADSRIKGIGVPDLHLNQISEFDILCPPRDLQEQFIALVEQTDKSKLAVQKALDELEILKKSLMQQYFG